MSDLGWYGRTWYDRRQNEELGHLSSQLARQRSESARLTAQLSQVQGNLDHRLGRLATAFDAFVELSDLREELRVFQPAVAARHRARRVLSRLMATGGSADQLPAGWTAADPAAEMPGYWLPSALAGVLALLRSDEAATTAELAEARACDAPRTDLFVCLALLLVGQADDAAGHLATLLDVQPDRPVIRAQRELWQAAAAGRFDAEGRTHLVDHLVKLVDGLPEGTRATQAVAWHDVVDQVAASAVALPALPARVELPAGLTAPIQAAGRLAALADWYEQAMSPPERDEQPPSSSDDDPPDPLEAMLQELVDEGAPEEQPLLVRVAELRRIVESDGGQALPAPPRWHAPVGLPLDLLMVDVRSTDPNRKAVAARAAAPLLEAIADDLAATAQRSAPAEVEVRLGPRHQLVRFRAEGVDPATVAEAKAAALAAPPPTGSGQALVGGGLLGAAAAAVGLGAVAGVAGIGVIGGGILAAIGGLRLAGVRRAVQSAEYEELHRQKGWDTLEQQIARFEIALAELRTLAAQAPEGAAEALARLKAHVATARTPT